jgi:DNA-binding response OmpR family regulator
MNKILIVDPSVTFANFISFALIRSGYRIVHSTDAEKAREILSMETFDLLIFEIRLPGMDGFEFCKTIKMQPSLSNIPLVIISIDGTPESRQYAREIGCCDYLTKPLSLHSLHEVMQRHLPFISSAAFSGRKYSLPPRLRLDPGNPQCIRPASGREGCILNPRCLTPLEPYLR